MTDLEQAILDLEALPFHEFWDKWRSNKEIWDKLIWTLECFPGKPCKGSE